MSTLEEMLPEFSDVINEVIKRQNISNYKTVVKSAFGKGENFLSLIYKIKVYNVDENGEEQKLRLILKAPLKSEIFREKFQLARFYIREAYVYNVILPELCALQDKFNFPVSDQFHHIKCYRADCETYKEILLMEDMQYKNFKMVNRREPLEYESLKLILKRLASFHALSYVMKKVNPEKFSEMAKHAGDIHDYPDKYEEFFQLAVDRAIAVLDDDLLIERLKAFAVDVMDKLEFYHNHNTIVPNAVLCHGDCWNNNVLFKFEGKKPVDVMLLDWQLIRICSPITDIGYLIFSSTSYELRKRHFRDLMDFYHESLAKSLSNMDCDIEEYFPKDAFEYHLKKVLTYGLVMSLMLLPTVLGETEDVPDFDILMAKDALEKDDWKFTSEVASDRYNIRIKGLIRSFVEMDMI